MTNEVSETNPLGPTIPVEESTGDPALDELLSRPILQGHKGVDTAQVWMSAFLIVVAGIIAYSTLFTIPLYDYAGFLFAHPALFHAVSLCLHLAGALFIFLIFRALAEAAVPPVVAMLAGLVFVLHPAATQTVNSGPGLSVLLATALTLLALLLFIKATQNPKEPSAGLLALSVAAFTLASLAGPVVFILPLLIVLTDFFRHGRHEIAARLKIIAVYLAVAAVLLVARTASGQAIAVGAPSIFVLTEYVRLLIAPTNLSVIHLPADSLDVVGLAGSLLLVLAAIWLRGLTALAVVWVLLSLSLASGTGAVVSEPKLYLPLAGLALLVPVLFSRITNQPARVVAGLVSAVLVFVAGGATFQRNNLWHDNIGLWSDAVADTFQKDGLALAELGRAYLMQGDLLDEPQAGQAYLEAVKNLEAAAAIAPDDIAIREDLGIALSRAGRPEQALGVLTDVVRDDVTNRDCLLHTADLLFSGKSSAGSHDARRAVQYYQRAHALKPLTGDSRVRYAMALLNSGRIEDGVPLLAAAAEDPGVTERDKVKAILANVQGTLTQAQTAEEQAFTLLIKNARDTQGLKLRAQSLALTSRYGEAIYILDYLRRNTVPDLNTWILAGFVWAKRNETAPFIQQWDIAVTKPASVTSQWTELAKSCAASGMWDAALAYLESEPAKREAATSPRQTLQQIADDLKRPLPNHLQNTEE